MSLTTIKYRGKVTGIRRVACTTEVTISVPVSEQMEENLVGMFGLPVEVEMAELPSDMPILRGGN